MVINLDEVTANRRSIIKQAIEDNRFYLYTYALYFETGTNVLKKDLEVLYPDNPEQYYTQAEADLALLVKKEEIKDLLREADTKEKKETLLTFFGMWHEPVTKNIPSLREDFEITNEILEAVESRSLPAIILDYKINPSEENKTILLLKAENIIPHFYQCMDALQAGLTKTDLQKWFSLTPVQTERLGRIANAFDIQRNVAAELVSHEEVRQALEDIVNDASNLTTLSQSIGISRLVLEHIKAGDYDMRKEAKEAERQQRIEEKQEAVYNDYMEKGGTHGPTEEEIAKKYNITRTTASAYITEYKKRHMELTDDTQLSRSKHNGKEAEVKRTALQNKVVAAYDILREKHPELNDTEIINQIYEQYASGFTSKGKYAKTNMIKKFLRETGRMLPYTEQEIKEGNLKEMGQNAAIGLSYRGQFGYGATPHILARQEYKNDKEKWNAHMRVLNQQGKAQALMRNSPEAKRIMHKTGDLQAALKAAIEKDYSPIGRAHIKASIVEAINTAGKEREELEEDLVMGG